MKNVLVTVLLLLVIISLYMQTLQASELDVEGIHQGGERMAQSIRSIDLSGSQ